MATRSNAAAKKIVAIADLDKVIPVPVTDIPQEAFNLEAFTASVEAFAKAKTARKDARKDAELIASKEELQLLWPAIEYASRTFDLQPIASYMLRVKPAAIVQRAILGAFPSHRFALVKDGKGKARGQYVVKDGLAKVADNAKLGVLNLAYAEKQAFTCDRIKTAFPAPAVTQDEAKAKAQASLAKLVKGLDKATIAEMLKGL